MPRSNKLIELKEEIHPDLHAKVIAFARANDFELGYAVEHILQTFFSDPKNVPAKPRLVRTKSAPVAPKKAERAVA